MGRASLIESQNHLIDFVDRGYITEEQRQELHALAEKALEEVTGLIETCSRRKQPGTRSAFANVASPRAQSAEPRTPNRTSNREHEPGSENKEPGT